VSDWHKIAEDMAADLLPGFDRQNRRPAAMSRAETPSRHSAFMHNHDHRQLAMLPAYQAARQAISDLANQTDGVTLDDFLKAARDMALTAPYGDMCEHCSPAPVCWPHAVRRRGRWMLGAYRCPAGHEWVCHWAIDLDGAT
jgi:hypothetical protein